MKRFLIIITITILLVSCFNKSRVINVPAIYADMNKNNFITRNGVTLLDNKVFSGWQYCLYPNGDTSLLIPFIDGKEEGTAKQWYENGQSAEIRFFENGKRTGEHKGWWENGQLKFIHHYADDLFDGSQQEWYEDGTMYKLLNYVQGHEKGLQKIWRPDGRLHANYVVRNGRNYGLTGNMHCKNTWKDGM